MKCSEAIPLLRNTSFACYRTFSRIESLLLRILANLIAYCAGCLARGLAGSLALAAAAFFNRILQLLCIQSLDMFHPNILLLSSHMINLIIA